MPVVDPDLKDKDLPRRFQYEDAWNALTERHYSWRGEEAYNERVFACVSATAFPDGPQRDIILPSAL